MAGLLEDGTAAPDTGGGLFGLPAEFRHRGRARASLQQGEDRPGAGAVAAVAAG